MADNDRDHSLDQLLDAALARYSAVALPPGLEERTLARLRERPSASVGWRLGWWAAAAATGVVMAVAAWFVFQSAPEHSQPARPLTAAAPPVAPGAAAPASVEPAPVPPRPSRRAASAPARGPAIVAAVPPVRRDRFPTPLTLSEKERLLLTYVREVPPEILLARAAPPRPGEVIIQDVEIAPVKVEDVQLPPQQVNP